MLITKAIDIFKDHQRSENKLRTNKGYNYLLKNFEDLFGTRELESITPEEIYKFLEVLTESYAKTTKRLRYAQIKCFFNFMIDKFDLSIKNPCRSTALSKSYRAPKQKPRRILEKEAVDEMIYNTRSIRDRLILELQARCGLRIGEVLKLRVSHISDRKILIREPKSGKEAEIAYMPEQTAKRLSDYIRETNLSSDSRPFNICYSTARSFVKRIGEKVNQSLTPHDLRRHSATYASRNGVPLEIISKVILRHQDLKTTQTYLGKVTDAEAVRWMDTLHGK